MMKLSAIMILIALGSTTSAQAPQIPSASDSGWLVEHRERAFDALMPVGAPEAIVSYRSYRDTHFHVVERYFSIRFGEMTARGFDRYNVQASLVSPIGRSIQAQLLDLHMKEPTAPLTALLSQVAIARVSLSTAACPAIRARMVALSRVRVQAPEWKEINLHPVLHRIVMNGSAGRVDATLENNGGPLANWAIQTSEALLACARLVSPESADAGSLIFQTIR